MAWYFILLIVMAGLFILSLIIYFFNLDMKLSAGMQPIMHKIYDHRKRDRRL